MISIDEHKDWLNNPIGKIAKGGYCTHCNRFNARTMAVNVLLINKKSVLLVKRGEDPDKGWWDIPGGYLDWDETLAEGAARELKEETGLIIEPNDLVLFDTFSKPNNKAKNQVVDIYFIGKLFSGQLQIANLEIEEAKWFDLKKLPKNIAFDHALVLQKLIKK